MCTVLYRFDYPEVLSVLESHTTARAPVDVRMGSQAGESIVRIVLQRDPDETAEISVVFSLPLVAIDGRPQRFLLEACGDAGGGELLLEAADERGWGFAYLLGRVDRGTWTTYSADAQHPCESWGAYQEGLPEGIIPPIQLHRLRINMGPACGRLDLGLRALWVTGKVVLFPTGIATGGDQDA